MEIWFLPLPINPSIWVMSSPRRASARFFNPRLRESGSITHSATIVSKPRGTIRRPYRASMMKSYLRLCPILGMRGSVSGLRRADRVCSRGNCVPLACPAGIYQPSPAFTASEMPTRLAVISSVDVVSVSIEMTVAAFSASARVSSRAAESTRMVLLFGSEWSTWPARWPGPFSSPKRLNCCVPG